MGLLWDFRENSGKNLLDSLAMPSVGLVPQLKSLVNASRGSRWNCSPRKINLCKTNTLFVSLFNRNCQKIFQPQLLIPEDALLCGEVDLDGGVAPGVVDLASVDLLDGHPAGETADLKGSCTIKLCYVLGSLNIFLSFSDLSSLSACVTSRLQPMGSCYQARQLPRSQK